jgi:predicted PurR-regulated permease PerM
MPVILIGAMGGMAWGGIIGLFLGAILLAVGYQIFMDWVNEGEAIPGEETQEIELGGKAAPSGE